MQSAPCAKDSTSTSLDEANEAISSIAGVESVQVDLETKQVIVDGEGLDDAVLRAAIVQAGYEPE